MDRSLYCWLCVACRVFGGGSRLDCWPCADLLLAGGRGDGFGPGQKKPKKMIPIKMTPNNNNNNSHKPPLLLICVRLALKGSADIVKSSSASAQTVPAQQPWLAGYQWQRPAGSTGPSAMQRAAATT